MCVPACLLLCHIADRAKALYLLLTILYMGCCSCLLEKSLARCLLANTLPGCMSPPRTLQMTTVSPANLCYAVSCALTLCSCGPPRNGTQSSNELEQSFGLWGKPYAHVQGQQTW